MSDDLAWGKVKVDFRPCHFMGRSISVFRKRHDKYSMAGSTMLFEAIQLPGRRNELWLHRHNTRIEVDEARRDWAIKQPSAPIPLTIRSSWSTILPNPIPNSQIVEAAQHQTAGGCRHTRRR
jgi:hypothetical protein